jgi:hypothetical protein
MCRRAGSRLATGQEGLNDAADCLGADTQPLQERGHLSLGLLSVPEGQVAGP